MIWSATPRKLAVVLGVAVAIVVPVVQQTLGLGLSQAEFAGQGDSTLRAAGYAFSIWGVIYLGLIVFAVHQARAPKNETLDLIGWPAALAAFGCGLWIVAAAANSLVATVIVILISTAAAIGALLRGAPIAAGRDRLLALVPVALLAGWLTVAAPLNVLTVLTTIELIPAHGIGLAALAGLACALLVALFVAWRSRVWAYPLPAAWGLAGVYAAERADKPVVAWAAAGAAVLLLVAAAGLALNRRRPR